MSDDFPKSLRTRLSFLLGSLYRRTIELEAHKLTTNLGIGIKQQAALTIITEEGPLSQQELGLRLGIDRTTIVAIVDDRENAGLVERTRNPADRRTHLITVTKQGKVMEQCGRDVVRKAERELLDGLSEQEIHTLLTLLARALSPNKT